MEFIKQIVAFAILAGAGEKLLTKSRDNLEDFWILASNTREEAMLLQTLNDDERRLYQLWIDKHLGGEPALKQEPAPEPEPEIHQEISLCVNCGAELETDPLTGLPVDRCQACEKSSSVKEEPEPGTEEAKRFREAVDKALEESTVQEKVESAPEPKPAPKPASKKSTKRK